MPRLAKEGEFVRRRQRLDVAGGKCQRRLHGRSIQQQGCAAGESDAGACRWVGCLALSTATGCQGSWTG
jgi:hypothetical protein